MDEDLSRLEELFFVEVGKNPDLSLDGFIEQVITYYKARRFDIKKEVKVISFDSRGVKNSLCFIVACGTEPSIAGIKVRGHIEAIGELLGFIQGDLKANFPNIEVSPQLYSAVATNGDSPCYRISRNRLASIELRKDSRFKSIREKLASLAAAEQELIKTAEDIEIRDDFYNDNNPNDTLLHLGCRIRNNRPTHYFDYSLSTANLFPLPTPVYPMVRGVFSVISNRLSQIFAYRGKSSNLGEVL